MSIVWLVEESLPTFTHMVSTPTTFAQYKHMSQVKYLSKQWIRQHCLHCLLILYFLLFSLVASLSIWMSPKRMGSMPLPFIDALFSSVSAFTETGLTNVEMHTLSILDQVTLLLLMAFGSQVFTSFMSLLIQRLYPYTRYYDEASNGIHYDLHSKSKLGRSASMPTLPTSISSFKLLGHKALSQITHQTQPRSNIAIHIREVNLPKHEREKVHQDIQNDAHKILTYIVLCYYIACIVLGSLACQICIVLSPHTTKVLQTNDVNSLFFSIFSTISSFGNCGFMLLDENLVPLRRSSLFLISLNVLMLLGNTMYAPTLHFIIWILYKRSTGKGKKIYGYLLKRPKHFAHLFPSKENTSLVTTVVLINSLQVICILAFDWNSKVFQGIGPGYRVVDALFQSITTRSAGMNVMDLALLSAPTLFIILIMM